MAAPLPAPPNDLCRRCQFSLTGLTPADDVLTCPECGLSGPVAHVAEPDPPPLPSWAQWTARMMWPVTLLALLAAILLIVVETQTKTDVVSILWLIVGITTIVMSIGVPLSVARDLSDEHIRERHRRRVLLRLTAVGFGLNVAQMFLIGCLVVGLLRER